MAEEENKVLVGEDIVAHLMAQHGIDKTVSDIKVAASKQGGRYKWKTGKILVVQAPVAQKNEKFIHSGGFMYVLRAKEADKDGLVSEIESRPLLTPIQLGELLGQLQASFPAWNPLSDPGARLLEKLMVNVKADPFEDPITGEDKTKVRFEIERDNAYKMKIVEAREMDELYRSKQKQAQKQASLSTGTGKVEDTVLGQ